MAMRRRVGQVRLDRATIVSTAREILRTEGWQALSMRRLAQLLGATPMALYHHVGEKNELLAAVLTEEVAELSRPQLPTDPRQRLIETACFLRGTLARMPWAIEILVRGEAFAIGALWIAEEMLSSALACGLSEDRAVATFRTLWRFVIGDLICEPRNTQHWPREIADFAGGEVPVLATLADQWSASDYDYRAELTALTDGLLAARH